VPREILIRAFRHLPSIDEKRFRADVDAILDQDIGPRA
jgi:hypothetical protein